MTGYSTAWMMHPPQPGDTDYIAYIAAGEAEAERLRELAESVEPPRLAVLDEIPKPKVPLDEQRKLAEMMAAELDEPITSLDGALGAAHGYVTRYVACPSPHEPVATVLWIAHAWAADAAETSPTWQSRARRSARVRRGCWRRLRSSCRGRGRS